MAKVPTIRDVAELADVSKATVSRYLNGSLALSPETVKHVDDAVVALNYRQNSLARRLSLGSSETVGLAMPEVTNPFFAELADAVEEAASESGYGLAFCITRNKLEREALYLRWLDTRHLDGLVFATNRPDDGSLRSLIGERWSTKTCRAPTCPRCSSTTSRAAIWQRAIYSTRGIGESRT